MIEVDRAHTKVANSEGGVSAYALFSSWPYDKKFKNIFNFYFQFGRTADELHANYLDVFGIIRRMLRVAKVDYDWATSASVRRITGKDESAAATILNDIQQHLDEAKKMYRRTTYAEFESQLSAARTAHAPSGSLLLLGPALAQLKALSAPGEGCDCACGACGACGACKTCVGAAVIRKKKQAGCRCTACAERATGRTAR